MSTSDQLVEAVKQISLHQEEKVKVYENENVTAALLKELTNALTKIPSLVNSVNNMSECMNHIKEELTKIADSNERLCEKVLADEKKTTIF